MISEAQQHVVEDACLVENETMRDSPTGQVPRDEYGIRIPT